MCSFIRDDRGVTEPLTDLPSLGLVAVGLIIFFYMVLSAYSSYASSAYYAAVRSDLASVARAAASDPSLTCSPYTMDARMLDNASKLQATTGYRPIQYAVDAKGYRWTWGRASTGRSASYSLPVSVRLSDARCIPGGLKVTMWEG